MADPNQYYYTHPDDEYLDQDQQYYDYDQEQYPYDNSQERPSFTEYWKKSKDSQSTSSRGHKNIRFVQTTVPGASSSSYPGGYASGTDTDGGMGSDIYNTGCKYKDHFLFPETFPSPPPADAIIPGLHLSGGQVSFLQLTA